MQLKELAEQHARSNFSPSGIVTLAKNGEVLQQHTWGPDGYDERKPFRIASLTKSFTALALLTLRREGKLSFDDEVTMHLPELQLESPADWPALRLRHLLGMSGGLATDNPWADRQESVSREQLLEWAASGLRLIFAPGTSVEYSNLGYALLGEVITRASGSDYREYVLENILKPLGLNDTRFSEDELPSAAVSYHREPMLPGQPGGWTVHEQSGPGAFSAIGGLYSSVHDLLRWTRVFQLRDVPEGVGFTAADLLEMQETLGPVNAVLAEEPLHGPAAAGYGHGLVIERFARHGKVVSHSGGYPGFTSYMIWHVPSGLTAISSANGTHSAAPRVARAALLAEIAKLPPAKPSMEPWAETAAAAEALTQMVRDATSLGTPELIARYASLFADNVELDLPLARTLDYLRSGLVNVGAISGEALPLVTQQPCRATWSIPAEHGLLELFIELAPVAPFGVQTFSVSIVNGMGRVKLF